MNKALLLGNIGADPELRVGGNGGAVLRIRMATTQRRRQGDNWVDETEWHRCVMFGERAENLSKHLNKGDKVLIEGKIVTRMWEKDGVKQYATEILVDHLEFAGGPKRQQNTRQQQLPVDNDPGDDFFRS